MRRTAASRDDGEGGFTLIELLAVIAILGVISFALTEAVILGFKTTDAVTNDVTRSAGVQALRSYFTGDAQRADQASTLAISAPPCAAPSGDFLLYLSWTDQGTARDVSYSLDADTPPVAGQRELVRRSCTSGVTSDTRMLGHFDFDPAERLPVLAQCDPACSSPSQPATITLSILTNRPKDPLVAVDLTVRRRTT